MLWGAHGRWHHGGNTCERYHVESKEARAWWRSHKAYFNPIWDTVPITSRPPAKLTLTPRCLGLSFQHKNSRGASLNYVQTIVHLKKDGPTCHHCHWHTGISFQKTLDSQRLRFLISKESQSVLWRHVPRAPVIQMLGHLKLLALTGQQIRTVTTTMGGDLTVTSRMR